MSGIPKVVILQTTHKNDVTILKYFVVIYTVLQTVDFQKSFL